MHDLNAYARDLRAVPSITVAEWEQIVALIQRLAWQSPDRRAAWSDALIAVDLRMMKVEHGPNMPGCRVLAERWGVSESKATRILRAARDR